MRVIHVISSLAAKHGGTPRACLGFADAMARRGHTVVVCASDVNMPDGDAEISLIRDGADGKASTRVYRAQLGRPFNLSIGLARGLVCAIRQADIVHVHSLYLYHDWVAGTLCRWFGVPYLISAHGCLVPTYWSRHRRRKRLVECAFQNGMSRRAAAFHFMTEDERAKSLSRVHGRPGYVVPLGVFSERYRRALSPRRGAAGRILFLGRLHPFKGADILVEAFSKIASNRDVELVLAGPDYGAEGALKRRVETLGLAKRVVFAGMLSGEAKLAALRNADVFVLPSHSENFGISVIEALAAKLPVVISDRVGVQEDIAAAGAGVVTSLDPRDVAKGIARVLDNPDATARMVEAGYWLVREKYDWAAIGAQLERVYEQVIAERAGRSGRRADSRLTQSPPGRARLSSS